MFCGPISEVVRDKVLSMPINVKFLGAIKYKDVPKLINSFEIATMPFIINDLIEAVNPVKIYEYLALGKKVIASKYSETQRFGNLISLYSSSDEFKNLIGKRIDEKENSFVKQQRVDFALKNDWATRASQFREICRIAIEKGEV